MSKTQQSGKPVKKEGLHPRNPHRSRYDFSALVKSCPELAEYIFVNRYGNETINFDDPSAVKMLNRALLRHFYGINNWDIPEGYLCPPIPGRADYIHRMADILGFHNGGVIPSGNRVSVLDTGTGANLVYPLIGNKEYGWRFTGSDIDPGSIDSAQKIIDSNPGLSDQIDLRLQKSPGSIFRGVIRPGELFDITMCNPPFHTSPEEAARGTLRKRSNLNLNETDEPVLNFGGRNHELCTPGGEEAFVHRMIKESVKFSENVFMFTTLVSKKTTLTGVYRALKREKATDVKTVNMAQGQKISRFVAWTFMGSAEKMKWRESRWI